MRVLLLFLIVASFMMLVWMLSPVLPYQFYSWEGQLVTLGFSLLVADVILNICGWRK